MLGINCPPIQLVTTLLMAVTYSSVDTRLELKVVKVSLAITLLFGCNKIPCCLLSILDDFTTDFPADKGLTATFDQDDTLAKSLPREIKNIKI